MKRYLLAILVILFIYQLAWAAADDPSTIIVKKNNILPQTSVVTIFDNQTSAFTNNTAIGSAYGLGDVKIRCHTWTLASDKTTADVTWTVDLEGSIDGTTYEDLDTTSTVSSFWKRDVSNKGANWVRANVIRNYTGTAPTLTIKYQGGCN